MINPLRLLNTFSGRTKGKTSVGSVSTNTNSNKTTTNSTINNVKELQVKQISIINEKNISAKPIDTSNVKTQTHLRQDKKEEKTNTFKFEYEGLKPKLIPQSTTNNNKSILKFIQEDEASKTDKNENKNIGFHGSLGIKVITSNFSNENSFKSNHLNNFKITQNINTSSNHLINTSEGSKFSNDKNSIKKSKSKSKPKVSVSSILTITINNIEKKLNKRSTLDCYQMSEIISKKFISTFNGTFISHKGTICLEEIKEGSEVLILMRERTLIMFYLNSNDKKENGELIIKDFLNSSANKTLQEEEKITSLKSLVFNLFEVLEIKEILTIITKKVSKYIITLNYKSYFTKQLETLILNFITDYEAKQFVGTIKKILEC